MKTVTLDLETDPRNWTIPTQPGRWFRTRPVEIVDRLTKRIVLSILWSPRAEDLAYDIVKAMLDYRHKIEGDDG